MVVLVMLMLAAVVALVAVVLVVNSCAAKQADCSPCSSRVELMKCCRWPSCERDRGLDLHVLGDECAGETRESCCHAQPNVGISQS